MNKVVLLGNVGQKPEITTTDSTTIAKFSLAVKRRFSKEDETDWPRCIAFGKTAEFIEKYVDKGTKLCVEGRLQTGSYTNKDGAKVYTTDVICENVEFAESKKSGESKKEEEVPTNSDGFFDIPDTLEEELPFA